MFPGENLEQGGFTGSVGAEEETSRSGRDVEVEVEEERWLLAWVGELHALDSDSSSAGTF